MEADFKADGTERLDCYDFWRLCDVLTIPQAALLLLGEDPTDLAYDVENNPNTTVPNYTAIRTAIGEGLVAGIIAGVPAYDQQYGEYLDHWNSKIEVESLRKWLLTKGISTGFYFHGRATAPDFQDKNHERYAPKLAAAVAAWNALGDPSDLGGKSPKDALKKWLRKHASQFDLCDEDGKPNETGIAEIAKVANWRPTGGAPKTPSK
ncbi:MAG: hypothetical protein ACPG1C_04120 [Alphaproteobacteria bacterium]